jgi:hypothetical protein
MQFTLGALLPFSIALSEPFPIAPRKISLDV